MDIVQQETPAENPSRFVKELGTDVVGFGLGAMFTHLGLEYATTYAMNGVTDKATKMQDEIVSGIVKLLVGTGLYAAGAKYMSDGFGKKLVYGIGTGFFTSGGTDLVQAYTDSQ